MTVTTRQRAKTPQATDSAASLEPPVTKATSSTPKGSGITSDTDTGERPVREKLKMTSIQELSKDSDLEADHETEGEETTEDTVGLAPAAQGQTDLATAGDDRGRLRRKRSFEDVEAEHVEEESGEKSLKHSRKRSRDVRAAPTELSAQQRKISGGSSVEEEEEPPVAENTVITSSETNGTAKDGRLSTPERSDNGTEPTEDTVMTSPNNKRTLEDYNDGHQDKGAVTAKVLGEQDKSKPSDNDEAAADEERKAKRHRDSPPDSPKNKDLEQTEVPPSSEPANTSEIPTLAVPNPGVSAENELATAQPQTSASAFAASGFGSLAKSSTSPFASLGSAAGAASPFGVLGTSKPPSGSGFSALGASKDAPVSSGAFSGPGSTGQRLSLAPSTGPSPFGSTASGFGVLGGGLTGGGFGVTGARGFGAGVKGGLSTFASTNASSRIVGLNDKRAKPFGAPAGEVEEEATEEAAADEDGEESRQKDGKKGEEGENEKTDERFFKQSVETGEEDEVTRFSCRAKLYASQDMQWKERGVGTFKLNVRTNSEKTTARFIMRAEGSHRVVLNSPVKNQIKIEDPTGGPPKGKTVVFMGFLDGVEGACLLQLKMKTNALATELHDRVFEVQQEMA